MVIIKWEVKKCAKSTILNIEVIIRKYKWHQKIPWVRFAVNFISNCGLILDTNGARDQNIIFIKNSIKNYLFSRICCVQNHIIVANIVSSKSYPRNLLVPFIFSNYQFYVQDCRFRACFCRFTANQVKILNSTSHSIITTHSASYI